MKVISVKIVAFFILMLLWNFSYSQKSSFTTYGKNFQEINIIPVNEVPKKLNANDSLSGVFTGIIESSCKMKGCWMTVRSDKGDPFRITFEDYGFFVPKEGLSDKKALFSGYCIRKTTSVAELQHYAEDAGKGKNEIALITKPKEEFRFVASGVKIEE
ncbi:MAG: DUF4920 domain-containing protein [Reichenbachiella sp.]